MTISIPLVEFSDRVLLRGRLFFAPAFVRDDQSYYPNRQQASKRKLLRAGKCARLSPELFSAVISIKATAIVVPIVAANAARVSILRCSAGDNPEAWALDDMAILPDVPATAGVEPIFSRMFGVVG